MDIKPIRNGGMGVTLPHLWEEMFYCLSDTENQSLHCFTFEKHSALYIQVNFYLHKCTPRIPQVIFFVSYHFGLSSFSPLFRIYFCTKKEPNVIVSSFQIGFYLSLWSLVPCLFPSTLLAESSIPTETYSNIATPDIYLFEFWKGFESKTRIGNKIAIHSIAISNCFSK